MMRLSEIGIHQRSGTDIDDWMEDLSQDLHSGDVSLCQLHGGSPALMLEEGAPWLRRHECIRICFTSNGKTPARGNSYRGVRRAQGLFPSLISN